MVLIYKHCYIWPWMKCFYPPLLLFFYISFSLMCCLHSLSSPLFGNWFCIPMLKICLFHHCIFSYFALIFHRWVWSFGVCSFPWLILLNVNTFWFHPCSNRYMILLFFYCSIVFHTTEIPLLNIYPQNKKYEFKRICTQPKEKLVSGKKQSNK